MGVSTSERPAAEVDPQLVDLPVGPEVGDDRDGKIDLPALSVEMENYILKAVPLDDDVRLRPRRRAAGATSSSQTRTPRRPVCP